MEGSTNKVENEEIRSMKGVSKIWQNFLQGRASYRLEHFTSVQCGRFGQIQGFIVRGKLE